MTQRSAFKSATYWKEQVAFLTKSTRRFQELAKERADDDVFRERGKRTAWSKLLDLLRAHYSAGSPIEKLLPIYKDLTKQLADYLRDPARLEFDVSQIDHYVSVLAMLSLGLLLGAGAKELAPVLEFAGPPGHDRLFDRLAGRTIPARSSATPIAHPKPFALLDEALVARNAELRGHSEYLLPQHAPEGRRRVRRILVVRGCPGRRHKGHR